MIRVELLPEAESDLQAALDWYEARRSGLGGEFLESFEDALSFVADAPHRFPVIHAPLRRVLLSRFPYAVFYSTNANTVIVFAVFHCSRDPQVWVRRLSPE